MKRKIEIAFDIWHFYDDNKNDLFYKVNFFDMRSYFHKIRGKRKRNNELNWKKSSLNMIAHKFIDWIVRIVKRNVTYTVSESNVQCGRHNRKKKQFLNFRMKFR